MTSGKMLKGFCLVYWRAVAVTVLNDAVNRMKTFGYNGEWHASVSHKTWCNVFLHHMYFNNKTYISVIFSHFIHSLVYIAFFCDLKKI